MTWRAFIWKILFAILAPLVIYGLIYAIFLIFGIQKIPALFDSLLTEFIELACIIYVFDFYKPEVLKSLNTQALKLKNILILIPLSILVRVPIGIIFAVFAIFNLFPLLSKSLAEGVKFQWSDLAQPTGLGFPIDISLAILITVVLTPITEELFFRGGIFNFLRNKYSPTKAIIATSALFALAHVYVGLFIGSFILGLALTWVYYKWGNIKYSILLHALINLLPFVLGLFSK